MTYARPDLLAWAPWVAAGLGLLVLVQWLRGVGLVRAYGGRSVGRRLLGRDLTRFPITRLLVLALAGAALVLAAAEPQPEGGEEPAPQAPIDLIVAVDVSHSMTADDVDGGRIARARTLVEEIARAAVADRMALSIFADWPYSLVPLTDDEDVVTFFAPWITPALMTTRDQGTTIPLVVEHALEVRAERPHDGARTLLLIVSDGDSHGGDAEILAAVGAAADEGLEVWTAGVGTGGGAPLYVPGSGQTPLLYEGSQVVATYDADLLQVIAQRGRGDFHDVTSDSGLRALIDELRGGTPPAGGESEPEREPAFWLILAALALLGLEAALDAWALTRTTFSRRGGEKDGQGERSSGSRHERGHSGTAGPGTPTRGRSASGAEAAA